MRAGGHLPWQRGVGHFHARTLVGGSQGWAWLGSRGVNEGQADEAAENGAQRSSSVGAALFPICLPASPLFLWLLLRTALKWGSEKGNGEGLPFPFSLHRLLSFFLSPLSTRYAFRRLVAPGPGSGGQNQRSVRMVTGEGGLESVGRLAGCGPGRRPSSALKREGGLFHSRTHANSH